jgi:hypothetical protein
MMTNPSSLPDQVNGTVVLNDRSNVVGPNILADNGVIHAIDTVLLPSDFAITTDKIVKGYKASDFLTRLVHPQPPAAVWT